MKVSSRLRAQCFQTAKLLSFLAAEAWGNKLALCQEWIQSQASISRVSFHHARKGRSILMTITLDWKKEGPKGVHSRGRTFTILCVRSVLNTMKFFVAFSCLMLANSQTLFLAAKAQGNKLALCQEWIQSTIAGNHSSYLLPSLTQGQVRPENSQTFYGLKYTHEFFWRLRCSPLYLKHSFSWTDRPEAMFVNLCVRRFSQSTRDHFRH